ncbi:hypothetical protein [Sphingomonas sp.]|uniref:hypothetical protein n=1 Tax=Sphingomonas sp. TaxID=28214 RepID=UPI0025F37BFE|nr:hypothetical protein [Sphingomonas sp.]
MRGLIPLTALLLGAAATPAKVDMAAAILPPLAAPGKAVVPFVKYGAGRIALAHVRIIDGTGAPAADDRMVLIDGGTIAGIGAGGGAVPGEYRVIDATGQTVMPGIVGMHDHMYYAARPNLTSEGKSEPPIMVPEMAFSSPRMYLAAGVTTMRTTGAVEPATDVNIKRAIDRGELPGPHMDVTGPYLEGASSPFIQM